MKLSYDKDIYNKSNIFNNNINSSRSFFGNSSKLENLQNLYFHLNPYSNSTSIKSNQQLKDLQQFQTQTEPDKLGKKYAQPNVNNYKRFHFKVEEVKKGKKFKNQSPYTPVARDNPNLAFYSVGDLATLHPLTYQGMQTTKRFINSNTMKNNVRMQMMEEKLRKYEEKSEGLQILNNLFFDSLKDSISQSLKRKAFVKRHLKELEYLKNKDLEEYNNQVDYINKLVDENNIDFDNYDDNGEPLNGVQNLESKMEAMKTEIGTMLTKNTIKNDADLNVLRKDVDDIKKELEDKLIEFSSVNNKNFEIIQEYLCREEEDRLKEKKRKEEEERIKRENMLNAFIPDQNEIFEIKAKKKEKKEKPKKIKKSEESQEGEVSTESNKDLDVIDKMLLDSMTVTATETENNSSSKTGTSKKTSISNALEEDKEIDLRSESSKSKKDSKNKNKKKWKLIQKKDTDTIEEENGENEVEGDENVILGSYKSKFKSNKPEIQSKRSKKSKRFKISKETEEEENEDEEKEDEEKEDNKEDKHTIEGSYNRSNFYTNNPEIERKSKRSKNSKKFKLTDNTKNKSSKNKELKDNEENLFSSENKKSKTKSKSQKKTVSKSKKDEEKYKPSIESKEEENEDNEEPKDKDEENKIIPTESSSVYTESFKLTHKTGEKTKSLVNLKDIKEDEEVYLANDISNLNSNNGDKKSRKSKKSKKSKKKSIKTKSIKEENEEDEK